MSASRDCGGQEEKRAVRILLIHVYPRVCVINSVRVREG